MIRAFIQGVIEFRNSVTTHYSRHYSWMAYEWGRELAHRVTLRRWDN